MGSSSPTEALQKVYEDHKKRLDELSERIPLPEECCGVVFACRDRVLGVDVFDKPETLRKLWPKVIRSYAVDALEERQDTPTVSRERVREWLAKAREAKTETYESPGVGEDVRFQSDDVVGGSLVVEKEPVHVGIFANLN
ncbi:MAG: hypothetical protein O7J95_13335, partial [Planctomycetota bacterium]|nr:hypothetical protein [Planctomycetota bacterium]